MNTSSKAPPLTLVKDGKPAQRWVKCKHPKCYWLSDVTSRAEGEKKARAHVSAHETHIVEIHTVTTDVIRGSKAKNPELNKAEPRSRDRHAALRIGSPPTQTQPERGGLNRTRPHEDTRKPSTEQYVSGWNRTKTK